MWCGVQVVTSACRVKLLSLISIFMLSYAIHFLSQLEVERTDLASHNFHTSPLIHTERSAHFSNPEHVIDIQSANQPAFLEVSIRDTD